MKILLITHPKTYISGSTGIGFRIGFPLGMMYVAAVLDKNGYDVEVLDTLLPDNYKIVNDFNNDLIVHGLPWEVIKEKIKIIKPDVVGITNQFSQQITNAIIISEIVKQINPDIITVIGGNHVSVDPSGFLKEVKSIDFVVYGEGEFTMLDLIKCLESKENIRNVKGLAYRDGNNIVLNDRREFIKDLDILPYPAYSLVGMKRYLYPDKGFSGPRPSSVPGSLSMITTRGCPYGCIFCAAHIHMGKRMRAHSPAYVIDHIEYVVKAYGVRHIHFEDDNFTFDNQRCEAILDGLVEKKLNITWDTPNGVRADKLSKSLLQKMKKSGCTLIALGVESGDQAVLTNIVNKHLNLSDIVNAAKLSHELDIPTTAFYLMGFPGERKENIQNTIRFAQMLKDKYNVKTAGIGIVAPLYGTRLLEICKEQGYLVKELIPQSLLFALQSGMGMIKTDEFSPDELRKINEAFLTRNNRSDLLNKIRKVLKNPLIMINRIYQKPERAFSFFRLIKKVIWRDIVRSLK